MTFKLAIPYSIKNSNIPFNIKLNFTNNFSNTSFYRASKLVYYNLITNLRVHLLDYYFMFDVRVNDIALPIIEANIHPMCIF